jgi:hypothetical protein
LKVSWVSTSLIVIGLLLGAGVTLGERLYMDPDPGAANHRMIPDDVWADLL